MLHPQPKPPPRSVALIGQPLASWMTRMMQRVGLRKKWLDSGYNVEFRINVREGDGDGGSPPIDRESEDEDGNRWWFMSRDSLILPAPLFFELDAFINRVTLKKEYKTRQKKKDKKNNAQNFPVSHDIPHFLLSILQPPHRLPPLIHTQPIPLQRLVDTRQRARHRHDNMRPRWRRGGCIRGERGQGRI